MKGNIEQVIDCGDNCPFDEAGNCLEMKICCKEKGNTENKKLACSKGKTCSKSKLADSESDESTVD